MIINHNILPLVSSFATNSVMIYIYIFNELVVTIDVTSTYLLIEYRILMNIKR